MVTLSGKDYYLGKWNTKAREAKPVPPVVDEVVDATLPHLPEVVADMVRFPRLTGCRPAEVCLVRPCDLDTSGDVWVYRPESHKTEHHGRERAICIGPKGQDVLRPYLLRPEDAYCFSPRESERKRLALRHERRRVPLALWEPAGHEPEAETEAAGRRPILDRFRPRPRTCQHRGGTSLKRHRKYTRRRRCGSCDSRRGHGESRDDSGLPLHGPIPSAIIRVISSSGGQADCAMILGRGTMSGKVDPYHRWLGIPAEEQPPHHYRLLGLAPFEDDPEVIRDAAERQMAHVRGYALGRHAELSQRILNELAAAKACLSEPAKKAEYDRRLRRDLAASKPVPPPMVADTRKRPETTGRPVVRERTSTRTRETGVASAEASDTQRVRPARPGASVIKPPLVIAGGAAGLLFVAVLGLIIFLGGNEKGSTGRDEPPPEPSLPVRVPLRILPIEKQAVEEGKELSFSVQVEDAGVLAGELRYGLDPGPADGATIDAKTGKFAWTPKEEHGPGVYPIKVRANVVGSDNLSEEKTFEVEVRELNQIPVIEPVEDQIVPAGEASTFSVTANDYDQPTNELTFGLPAAPQWIVIDPLSGTVTCTPKPEHAGMRYELAVRVRDNGQPTSLEVQEIIKIRVVKPGPQMGELLSAAQSAMVSGDLQKAREHLIQAQEVAGSPTEVPPFETFWTAAGAQFGGLKGLDELTLGGEPIAIVVERDGQSVSIKYEGRTQPYTAVSQLPWQLAVALAQRGLPRGDPATKLSVACFLAMRVADNPQEFTGCCQVAGLVAGKPSPPPFPKPSLEPPPPKGPAITLNLEKQRCAYDLEADKALREGDLIIEISGAERWAVPGTFDRGKNQVPLNGKVTIQFAQIPGAEIGLKFVRFPDGLKLQMDSALKGMSRRPYAITPSEVERMKRTLPKNLEEARARFVFLNNVGPQLSVNLGKLQAELARELSKDLRSRDTRKITILNGQIQNLQRDIKKGTAEFKRLLKEVPQLETLTLQVLPTLANLVTSLHNRAKLSYRIFPKTSDDP